MRMKENIDLLTIIEELREENRQLKAILRPPDNKFYGRLGLSPQLAALANAFQAHGDLSHAKIDAVISIHAFETRGTDLGLLNARSRVAVCKLRGILRPHGVTIEHVPGAGYRLDATNKARLAALVEGRR